MTRPSSGKSNEPVQPSPKIPSNHEAKRKKLSRSLRLEALEDRRVMDAYFSYGMTEFRALGTTAVFDGVSESQFYSSGGTKSSTSPITVSPFGLTAPDGGVVQKDRSYFSNLEFYPKNGLVTVENGQKNDELVQRFDGIQFFRQPLFAQQQEINFESDPFRPNDFLLNNRFVQFSTVFTPLATGLHTFYFNARNRSNLGVGGTNALYSHGQDAKLSVSLTAGVETSFVLTFERDGWPQFAETKISWEGPGSARQKFVPQGDIVWKTMQSVGDNFAPGPLTGQGFVANASTFTADKRERDDNYSLIYRTNVTIPTTGNYTFFLDSDASASIKIGSEVVLNKSSSGEQTVTRSFAAGTKFDLELKYDHLTGNRFLRFDWAGPNIVRQRFTPTSISTYEYYQPGFVFPSTQGKVLPPKTFALAWGNNTTAPIPLGASAETVQNALASLPSIGSKPGNISVIGSSDGSKYKIQFGGDIFFRPNMLKVLGAASASVRAITQVAITKRIEGSPLKVKSLGTEDFTTISNGATFSLDNAPMFTPELLFYQRTTTAFEGRQTALRLSGYLQTPAIGGRFDPEYGDLDRFNVENSATGLRLTNIATPGSGRESIYRLNALKDSAGNSRPITLFSLGGLQFEASPGAKVILRIKDSLDERNNLEFESLDSSMLVSAPFEGGRLTLRLLPESNTPIFTANLRTGQVKVTPKFEFVSFEIGGFTIPASDQFKMTYDAANSKFQFNINALSLATTPSILRLSENGTNPLFRNVTQVFERNVVTREMYFSGWEGLNGDIGLFSTMDLPSIRRAFNEAIDGQRRGLTDSEKAAIKEAARISVDGNRITISNIPYLVKVEDAGNWNTMANPNAWVNSYRGTIASPVKMQIPSGSISIVNGKLLPISSLPVSSFEIGKRL